MSASAEVAAFYRGVGCTVFSTSQPGRARKQLTGLPDLYVVHPKYGGWFHEVKRGKDKQRPAQKAFQQVVTRANIGYVLGDVAEAQAFLVALGLLRRSA